MGNAARKARKRSGIPFVKAAKVGTPLGERAVPMVQKLDRTTGLYGVYPSNRALKRIQRMQDAAAGRSRWGRKKTRRGSKR